MRWNRNFLKSLSTQNHENLTLDSTGILLKDHSVNENYKKFRLYKIPEEEQLFAIVILNNNEQPIIFPLGLDDTLQILENPSYGETIAQRQFCAM